MLGTADVASTLDRFGGDDFLCLEALVAGDASEGVSRPRACGSIPLLMAPAWPPSVGARVRPVETAQVAFSPDGEPVPLPGEGPAWARLRYPLPSDGDDRLEALVADVEEGDAGSGGNAITSQARASLVWNDGSEQDDVSLAFLGPCVDERERSDAEAADVAADVVVPRNENENAVVQSARRAAAASDARGAFRFRRGDFAAAAAEYVEACASLLSAVPRKHARVLLPGDEKDWNLPPPPRVGASFDAFDENDAPFDASAPNLRVVAKPRVAVGARVRVLGNDGFARLAVVACVDSDDETCDVLFDETALEWEEEEEENAVAFSRLRGASLVSRGEDDDATKKQNLTNALETVVSVELADALLNVARCHSRLASDSLGLGGDKAAAAAAVASASASLSLRKSHTALFLRGISLASSRRFEDASRDLKNAARLASARARRGEEASSTRTDTLATTPTIEGLEGLEGDFEPQKGDPRPASLAADVAAIRAALRATRAAAKEKNRADRRLAAAILGRARAEGVDLGLDPESDLAKTGVSAGVVGRKEKDGSVPIGEAARVVAERVAGKRCAVS